MAINLPEDFLECTVCLEVMDEQSKALPCQHTFCKKCLEGVISNKGFLQCPECRADYPGTCVDDLRPNIWLMRIFDNNPNGKVSVKTKKHSVKESSKYHKKQESNRSKKNEENAAFRVCYAKAMYNFDALEEMDLSFKKGDIIYLYQQFDENWYEGVLNGKRGDVPAGFLKIMVPLGDFEKDKHLPLARAIYNFYEKREEEFIIRFRKGDILSVIKKIDDNWGEGILGEQHGIFPLTFVELNDAAKENLALEKSSDEEESCDCGESSPEQNENKEETSSPWVRLQPPKRQNSPAEKTEDNSRRAGRRLLEMPGGSSNDDSWCNPNAKQLARRASGPLLMDTAAVGGSNLNANKTANLESKHLRRSSHRSTKPRPRSEEELGSSRRAERQPDVYIALYSYAQQRSDELALIQGEQYLVTHKFVDGWFRGFHARSGQNGMFPGNYVGPIYSFLKPDGTVQIPHSPTNGHVHYNRSQSSPLSNTLAFQFPPANERRRATSSGQRQRSGSEPTDPLNAGVMPNQIPGNNERGGGQAEHSLFNWRKYFKRQSLQPPPYPSTPQNASNSRRSRHSRPPPIPNEPPPPYSPPSTSVPLSVPITIPCLPTTVSSPCLENHIHERYRVVASFPPQSHHELELKVGDVLVVVKKRSDGWFQGKSQRTGKIGLFPASFVERF